MTARIIVTSKTTGALLQRTGESNVHLSEASVVHMSVNKAQVDRVERIGKLVEVILKDGEVFTVDNFYNAFGGATNNSLVFDGDKGFWLANTANNGMVTAIDYKPVDTLHNEYASNVTVDNGDGWSTWTLGALGGLAVGAGGLIAYESAGHGNSNNSNTAVTAHPASTAVVLAQAESTATVSGVAHPDSAVTVYDHGQSIGVVTADHQGHWSLQAGSLASSEAHTLTASGLTEFETNVDNIVLDDHANTANAHLSGQGNHDVLIGGSGIVTFSGGEGHQTVLYDLLSNTDTVGGHSGLDTWTDFHLGSVTTDANADVLDISALLGSQVNASNIDQYVAVHYDATSHMATISIDRAGTGVAADYHQLISLHVDANPATGTLSTHDLVQNHQLLF